MDRKFLHGGNGFDQRQNGLPNMFRQGRPGGNKAGQVGVGFKGGLKTSAKSTLGLPFL